MTMVPIGLPVQHILVPNAINYYEFFIPRKGFAAIELIHCAGGLEIGFSQDYNSFIKNEYV